MPASAPKTVRSTAIDRTMGDLACEFITKHGLVPDPWQAEVLDAWLALDEHGRWAHLTCGLSVPRQNGKNVCLEVREVFGAVALGERILHTAHEVKTAQKHFRRLKFFFGEKANDPAAQFPELNALVKTIRSVNGQEAVLLSNGGSIEIVARSKNSARGFTVDTLVMDEAQEMNDDALEALMPTTSAAPLRNPQWLFTGTPPGPQADGEVFTRVRDDALGDNPGRTCWDEWSPDGNPGLLDLDDRELWRANNPALAAGRLQMIVVEGERKRFSPDGFARERLGVWPLKRGRTRAISAQAWRSCVADPPADGVKSFAVVFSQDGMRQAVAGAMRDGQRVHVNLIGAWSGPLEQGVERLADWLAERRSTTAQVSLLGGAGSAPLKDALLARKLPPRMIHVMSTGEYLDSCAMLVQSVASGQTTHPAGQEGDALDASVGSCDRQKRRRDGAFGWEATSPEGDELPIEAISAANWTARTTRRRPRGAGNRGVKIL